MSRCAICDYTAEDGSSLLNIAPTSRIRIQWNDRYQGFLCSDCSKSIRGALAHHKGIDYDNGRITKNSLLIDDIASPRKY